MAVIPRFPPKEEVDSYDLTNVRFLHFPLEHFDIARSSCQGRKFRKTGEGLPSFNSHTPLERAFLEIAREEVESNNLTNL